MNLVMPPHIENELIVAERFINTPMLTLYVEIKDTMGKVHFSEGKYSLYSINTKTGECCLFTESGNFETIKIDSAKQGWKESQNLLLPINDYNMRLLEELNKMGSGTFYEPTNNIVPYLTKFQYFNVDKYMQ